MPFTTTTSPLIRLTEARYSDDTGSVVSGGDPVAISTTIFDQDGPTPNPADLSNLFVAWGQFLDHDLSLTLESGTEILTADGLVAPLHRSDFVLDDDGARIPTNAITWQIDGSQIYGSSDDRTAALRSFADGHLRMGDDANSDMGLMPDADPRNFMAGDITGEDPVFLAGDVRANENPALSSLHTMMAREHNYWADRLAEVHPDWSDDQLFDGARQIVEYELQAITYSEWLPHLVGDAVGPDTGHDQDAEGQVSVEFSTAAFRFGHTMVSSTLPRMNEDGSETDTGDMAIMDAFFNPDPLRDEGIDAIIRGQAASYAQNLDTLVVDDLNFFLSTPDGVSGFSLVALNVLRGQDHGLQSYVDTRAALLGDIDPATLDPTDFGIITSNQTVQAQLAEVYDTVHDVDLWVGGLAEDAVDGTQMGPLFTYIIADQFTRTRAADETFGDLDPALGDAIIADVRDSTLSDIITRNTEIDLMQDDPFVVAGRGLAARGDVIGTTSDDDIDLIACDIDGFVTTGIGDDIVTLTGGTQISAGIDTGNGNDIITASSGNISNGVKTGNGDDDVTLTGSATADEVHTGNGNDTVAVEQSALVDAVHTGNGKDDVTIASRATASLIKTGTGNDCITLEHGADVGLVDGGLGVDQLKIAGGPYRIAWKNDDPTSGDGRVVYLNADGTDTDVFTEFCSIENVTCFTPGTRVITAKGALRIETLTPGDMVYTLDHGLQPVLWIGRTTVRAEGSHAPVQIQTGALGNHRPMEVSPQHRMLIDDWRCNVVCGTDAVLAPALHLINDQTITRRTGGTVDYIHLLFADHEIVLADGIPSESFHPGRIGVGAMHAATRAEIIALFPQLADDLDAFGPAARYGAKAHEVALIQSLA